MEKDIQQAHNCTNVEEERGNKMWKANIGREKEIVSQIKWSAKVSIKFLDTTHTCTQKQRERESIANSIQE